MADGNRNRNVIFMCGRIGAVSTILMAMVACGWQPPTADEIRRAYAAHVRMDPVHEVGLEAKNPPVVIPNQEPRCTSDGNAHFDCRIRVIFETRSGPRSQEQVVHVRSANGGWAIDSVN